MDKYEYRVKTEQMLAHLEKKEYQKAMDIAESIDWRRVKNASMLNTVSEIYEYNGEFKKGRDILFLAFDRASGSRKIVYRLGTLALKIKDIREATDCYEEFVKLAPKDPNQYILKYKILRTQGAALSDQIAALEEFKKAEYIEKWAYELAKLYDEAGMTAECLEECDDLILWFSEGKYVYLAMELKMKYKPLTPLQQEKYDSRPGAVKKQPEPVKQTESTLEEVDDENEYDEGSEEEVQESTVQRIDDAQVQEIPPEPVPMQEEFEIPEEAAQADVVPEEVVPEATVAVEETPMYREEEPEASVETPEEHTSAIKQVVTGATLEEALAQGVAVASGINIEEEAMKEREDEILANGQMMIDDILQKWEAKQKDHFGYIFSGLINVPEDGVYIFQTRSDDGSVLYIGNELVVNNDGSHAAIPATGYIALEKGFHPYILYYFEDYEGEHLSWFWKLPSAKELAPIPTSALFVK